jgi:hypothetical protein
MIRATFHSLKQSNPGKIQDLENFIQEYQSAVIFCLNYLWNSKIEWPSKDHRIHIWDREKDLLNCPQMIKTPEINYPGPLSARALKCAATQACGIVRAVSEKRIKDLKKRDWLLSIGKSPGKGLLNRIEKGITQPNPKKINCELNSICADIKWTSDKEFDGFVQLKFLWAKTSEFPRGSFIRVPIKHYRQSRKWSSLGTLKNSIELSNSRVSLRWKIPIPKIKEIGLTIAIDQGYKDCLSTSNRQIFHTDPHGHTLESIIQKMARKRWGSKALSASAEHRKNFINWSIRQLNLKGVREIRLENIENINFGRNVNRLMKHWTNTLIRDSVNKICEETGVLFTSVDSEYNSQRCIQCGWVQKVNRKGKLFKCLKCNHMDDADFNASQNILIRDTLFKLPFGFRSHRLNFGGFFWKPGGLFDGLGQELTVPVVSKNELINIS